MSARDGGRMLFVMLKHNLRSTCGYRQTGGLFPKQEEKAR